MSHANAKNTLICTASGRLPLPLAYLRGEAALDCRDAASAAARVARDKVQPVLALAELGVGRAAGLARDILHW